MNRKFLILASALLVSCGTTPVNGDFTEAALPNNEIALKFGEHTDAISAIESFYDKAKEALPQEENENFLFSPISYYMAVCNFAPIDGMLTPEALESIGVSSVEEAISRAKEITEGVQWADEYGVRGRMTNLVVDFARFFNETQKQIYLENYHASFLADYGKREDLINQWISNLTDHHVSSMDHDVWKNGEFGFVNGLFLNASYYGGGFYSTEEGTFNNSQKVTYRVGQMELVDYQTNDEYTAFSYKIQFGHYKNGEVRTVMPKKEGLRTFMAEKTIRSFFQTPPAYHIAEIKMPKQILQDSIDIGKAIKDLGVQGTEIVEQPTIQQNNTLEFQESGVYAYSLTEGVDILTSGDLVHVTLDRPYAFEIVDPNEVPLFYGEVRTVR